MLNLEKKILIASPYKDIRNNFRAKLYKDNFSQIDYKLYT